MKIYNRDGQLSYEASMMSQNYKNISNKNEKNHRGKLIKNVHMVGWGTGTKYG